MIFRLPFLLMFALLLGLPASPALACACCAEKGERVTQSFARGDYEDEELSQLGDLGTAQVFTTACGLECVVGIDGEAYEYAVALSLENGEALLRMSDGSGALRVALPPEIMSFAVDTDPLSDANHVVLYRELRMVGPVSGTGVFVAADGAQAEIILAGEGNQCWSAADFSHWLLDVRGERAEFRLFGGLKQP